MKKNHHIMPRKTATYLLTASLLFGSFLGVPTSKASAAAPVKLAKKSATLTIKKTDKKTTYGKAEINVQYLDNVLIKTIKYKSSNKKVAKVSSIGTVTAKKKGSAKITITVRYRKARKNRTKKLTYKVKVVMKDVRKKAKKTAKSTVKPTTKPPETLTTKPTIKPTVNPTKTPLPTNNLQNTEGKNAGDVTALNKIIAEQEYANDQMKDLNSDNYTWDNQGFLIGHKLRC